MTLGTPSYTRTVTYRVRYTTTAGLIHQSIYPSLKDALNDTHYPVNAKKELHRVITRRTLRQVLEPKWKERKGL